MQCHWTEGDNLTSTPWYVHAAVIIMKNPTCNWSTNDHKKHWYMTLRMGSYLIISVMPTTPYLCTQSNVFCRVPGLCSTWNLIYWNRIAFTDQYYFELSPDDHQKRTSERSGQQCDAYRIIARHIANRLRDVVWNVISLDTRTPMVICCKRGNTLMTVYVPLCCPFFRDTPGLI